MHNQVSAHTYAQADTSLKNMVTQKPQLLNDNLPEFEVAFVSCTQWLGRIDGEAVEQTVEGGKTF